MTTASSGSLANIREYAKFNYGVGMMPYDADAKDAPLKNRQVAYGYWIAAINRKTGEIESPFGAEN